jgi:cytochrome oxidase Cu insertion factor (SCO1/SenC/PrrC family)
MRKIVAVFAFLMGFNFLITANAIKQPMIGSVAPPFRVQSLQGKSLQLSDLRGKVVVLHFGAGW